jgi:hypothetical protein
MRLCLHFDINKSLIVADASSNRGFISSLNSLLSEAVWGECSNQLPIHERQVQDWSPLSMPPAVHPPSPNAVTFGTYLEDHTCISKQDRRKYKCQFTTDPWGSVYKSYLDMLENSLRIDPTHPNYLQHQEYPYFAAGNYQILPSFFCFIDYLVEKNYDFRIIFRSFGIDTPSVTSEFNMYCEGKHPFFQPQYRLDGSDPRFKKDLRFHLPFHSAMVRRTGDDSQSLHLAHISHENVRFFIHL